MKRDEHLDGIEYRCLPGVITIRGEEKPMIEGYFAKFDRWFHGPIFKEKIAPGAFAKTLKEQDVRALWNHNADFPLGRTRNNTLRLVEDDKGLWGQIDMPDTQIARDALTSVKRGDVSGASFGFEVEGEEWSEGEGILERTLTKVKLWEVSPVVFPAYSTTNISARSVLDAIGRPVADVLPRLVERSKSGRMTTEERSMFRAILSQNLGAGDDEEAPKAAETPHEPEPEDPALTDRKLLLDARCLVTLHKLKQLGVIKTTPSSFPSR